MAVEVLGKNIQESLEQGKRHAAFLLRPSVSVRRLSRSCLIKLANVWQSFQPAEVIQHPPLFSSESFLLMA